MATITLLLLIFSPVKSLATSFFPTPIKEQISRSDAVIIGVFDRKSYRKNSRGEVITEAYFKLEAYAGIDKNHLVNNHSFRVLIPGGEWEGLIYNVEGTPKLIPGKKVILILKQGRAGFTLANLGMSKFEIVEREGKLNVVSDVFSNYPNIGIMEWTTFEKIIDRHFSGGFIPLTKRKTSSVRGRNPNSAPFELPEKVRKKAVEKKRFLASEYSERKESEASPANESPGLTWPIILLALLGGISLGSIRSKR